MGKDDNLHASITHAVLAVVSADGLGRFYGRKFVHPGMHVNLMVHGIIGILHYQRDYLKNDFGPAYLISLQASKYLPLPCLMADLYYYNSGISTLHLLSGLIPFALSIAGKEDPHLADFVNACNLCSLAYYTINRDRVWGWYTGGAGILAYFVVTRTKGSNILYPLALALMDYCAHRLELGSFAFNMPSLATHSGRRPLSSDNARGRRSMGQDDVNASITHIVLACVAGNGLSTVSGKSFTHPGMHANFVLHGIIGCLHYQSGRFNNDFGPAYQISLKASRYLPLPCLMADLYYDNQGLSAVHLLSGLIPFAMSLAGTENPALGDLVVAVNVISLVYYSANRNREWGWYTAGSAVLAYFVAPRMSVGNIVYPLALALMDYCAHRLYGDYEPVTVGGGGGGRRPPRK